MAKTSLPIFLVFLVIVKIVHSHDIHGNSNDKDEDPWSDIAAEVMKNKGLQSLGAALGGLLQSGGGQGGNNVLQNVASLLGGENSKEGGMGGINPNVLSSLLTMMGNGMQQQREQRSEGPDLSGLFSMGVDFLSQVNGDKSLADYLPMLFQTFSDFVGPDAKAREKSHSDHAWMLPPVVERMHVYFDHFVNSELGRKLLASLGGEKFIKIFIDEKGAFNYDKFVEMMENHSFRRHWIRQVTDKIGGYIATLADPQVQSRVLKSGQLALNSYLKGQGFPHRAQLDVNRPVESITNMINYYAKITFDYKLDSKPYVKPAVDYVMDIFRLARSSNVIAGVANHRELSSKLADTVNLEVIEPIARVNRAFRFAMKVPQCDKYVMCLINQDNQEGDTLPELKKLLYKTSSLIASWFLSSHTGTSFWSLYGVITDESNCKARYMDSCHDFHLEEIKVTTEYNHNEL